MRPGWSRTRGRHLVAVVACCRRAGRLHLHRRRGRRMGSWRRWRRLLLSHEPLGHAHLFGHLLLTCAKFSCSHLLSTIFFYRDKNSFSRFYHNKTVQPAYHSAYEHRGAHATQVYPSSPAAVNYSSVVRLDLCVRAFAAGAASKRKEAIGRCHEMDEGVRGYIRVGKEAGRKRAGRHGEMKRSLSAGS